MEVQASGRSACNVAEEECEDYRVQVSSKKQVTEQMDRYKELLKKLLDGQTAMDPQTRERLLDQMLEKFTATVQDNVLVNGQPWDDAPDDEDEAQALESQLDVAIVETAKKRRQCPKRIIPHLVGSLKAERKLMERLDKELDNQTVKPAKMERDPELDNIMNRCPAAVKEVGQVIKAMKTLQQRAEGLCQVLNTRPSPTDQQIYQDVFGADDGQSGAPLPHAISVKRAVAMAEYKEGFTKRE